MLAYVNSTTVSKLLQAVSLCGVKDSLFFNSDSEFLYRHFEIISKNLIEIKYLTIKGTYRKANCKCMNTYN